MSRSVNVTGMKTRLMRKERHNIRANEEREKMLETYNNKIVCLNFPSKPDDLLVEYVLVRINLTEPKSIQEVMAIVLSKLGDVL